MITPEPQRLAIALLVFCLNLSAVTLPAQTEDALEVFQKGQSLLQEEKYLQAAELFRKAVKTDDEFGAAWFLLGYSLHMGGELEEAIPAHRRAAEFEGEQFQNIAVYNLACAYALTHQSEQAIETLEAAVQGGYDDLEKIASDSDLFALHPTTRFAKLLARLQDDEKQVEQLEQAQKEIDQERYEQAAEIYRTILKQSPDHEFATYRLGYALHGAGKLDEAIEYHQRASQQAGTRGIALYNWGCALSLKGEKQPALDQLAAAIEAGFRRRDAFASDPDLNNLREEPGFQELLAKLEQPPRPDAHGHESPQIQAAPPMPYSLGIRMQVDDEGITIVELIPDGAAERAGLKADDRIVKIGGKEIGDDPLKLLMPYLQAGDKIPFEIERAGERLTIEVQPIKR